MLIVLDHISLTSFVDHNTAPIAPVSSIATQRQSHRTDRAKIAPVSSIVAQRRSHHADQAKIAPVSSITAPHQSSKDRLQRRAISPLDRTQSPLSLPSSSIWPDLMNFFFGFCFFWVCGLRNDIIYLFGSWENVRKCKQQVENVFSIVFPRIQPNTRKYFPKHFLECNQTLENIFLSRKYFTPNQTQPKILI